MKKWNVLVVDDEVEIAEYVGDLVKNLLKDDVVVEVFHSGTKALKRMKEWPVDLLMTDIVMPVTDGFALLSYAAGEGKDTEVILLTAFEEFDYIYRANKIKACSYVVKAEEETIIEKAIGEAIGRLKDNRRRKDTVEQAKKQIEEVKQIFREEKVKQMLTYDEEEGEGDRQIIERIRMYIKEHAGEELTAATVAEVFHYSPAHLSRIFKENSGEKLSSYIMRQKLKEAKRLLVETDESIHDISTVLGYQSSQAFARAFRRELSMTPQEYRRVYGIR